jgi:hypothetical protein
MIQSKTLVVTALATVMVLSIISLLPNYAEGHGVQQAQLQSRFVRIENEQFSDPYSMTVGTLEPGTGNAVAPIVVSDECPIEELGPDLRCLP